MRFICATLHKMGNASKYFLNYIEAVHNCPAVRDVSLITYKEYKTKQKKTEERVDKLGFVQTFVSRFLHRSLFLLFFSSVSLLHVSATALKKWPCCNYSVCYLTRV